VVKRGIEVPTEDERISMSVLVHQEKISINFTLLFEIMAFANGFTTKI
jgi:hypothetical protein